LGAALLTQVWDDASRLPDSIGAGIDADIGRRIRPVYLLAEALVAIPFATLLGLTSKSGPGRAQVPRYRSWNRSQTLPVVNRQETLFLPQQSGASNTGRREGKIFLEYRLEVSLFGALIINGMGFSRATQCEPTSSREASDSGRFMRSFGYC
jgi:hypothetical protein